MAFRFMQIISFVYLLISLNCTESKLRHDEECSALFEFKQTILHQAYASSDVGGFHKLDSWRMIPSNTSDHGDSDSDCCFWDSVMCNNEGHVIGLDLSQSSLRGPIKSNSTLFNLVHLEMLNLSMNDFVESQIPPEIARLKQLKSLDLSNSGFNGQIPSQISELVQLSSLDLSLNSLKLRSPSLEYLVQNMTRLEELHLSGVDISSSVPRFLANFSSLTSIKLRNCGLRDEFPSSIFHLSKLKYLDMRNNTNLTGFLPEFHNNSLLEYLNLYTTSFGGNIPESLSKVNHLIFLGLAKCNFSGRIPGSLSNLTRLNVLELGYNDFEVGGFPDQLGKLTNLNEIYVSHTNIYDEIPPSLANLTKLSIAAMATNFIFGRIPSWFTNLTTLTVVDLGENQLKGSISNAFSNLKGLQFLSLARNNFIGRVYLDTFVGLNELNTLDLGHNKLSFVTTKNYTNSTLPKLKNLGLSSCNLKEFPAFLHFQTKMIGLFLDDNKIEGLVPEWIWNNSRETLQMLNLANNFITGFHQHSHYLLPWVQLIYFDISFNRLQGRLLIPPQSIILYDVSQNDLEGEIPPLICEVKFLQLLDLSSNHLIGTLPPCLGMLSNSLLVLNLKQNKFHGPIMNTFIHESPLKRIDLSENRFTGKVPKSLAHCTGLEVLAIGDNSFDDLFPFWLGNLQELQVLILRSNKFYGEIQDLSNVSSKFLNLRILDLSNNNFSGQLPDMSFRKWNAMKYTYFGKSFAMGFKFSVISRTPALYPYKITLTNKGVKREYERILNIFIAIDLSCNNFVGDIPQSLQDLQGLQSLNLSNNHLTGHILPSLGNLKNLESFDLSKNKLSGEIPQELLQLSYLAILNVSFNHLDGHIPQGKQFNTFDNSSYIGNLGLCGQPLSNDCESSKASTPSPTRSLNGSLFLGERIDWIIILLGFVSGLVVGIVVGNILYARYSHWFLERFGLRKNKWVRPLSDRRGN